MSSGDRGRTNESCRTYSPHDSGNWRMCDGWLGDRGVVETVLMMIRVLTGERVSRALMTTVRCTGRNLMAVEVGEEDIVERW